MKRRDFIKLTSATMAGAQLPLHLLLARSAVAQASGVRPKRVMFVFTPHGGGPSYDRPNLWQPNAQLTLPRLSAPLESVKQHILFMDGVSMYNNPHRIGDGHKQGNRKALTANGNDSLDIVIGDHFRDQTAFGSVQMGVMPNRFSHHDTPAYRNGQQVPFWDNPHSLYNQLFSGAPASGSVNTKESILSNAAAELRRLRTELGQLERERLEEHSDALSQLEQRLASVPTNQCSSPTISLSGVPDNRPNDESAIANIAGAMHDIAAQALACDLTRSLHFAYGHEANGVRLPGFRRYDHEASHDDLGQGGEFERYRIFWAERLRDLLTTFNDTNDGNDSLLNNTLIMHYSEIGHSNSHDHNRVPFFLAGAKNFGLQTNKLVRYSHGSGWDANGQPHSRLLASVGQFMGLNMTRFGDGNGILPNHAEIFS